MADFRQEMNKLAEHKRNIKAKFEDIKKRLEIRGFEFIEGKEVELSTKDIEYINSIESYSAWTAYRLIVETEIYSCIKFPKYLYRRNKDLELIREEVKEDDEEVMMYYVFEYENIGCGYHTSIEGLRLEESLIAIGQLNNQYEKLDEAKEHFDRISKGVEEKVSEAKEKMQRMIKSDSKIIQQWEKGNESEESKGPHGTSEGNIQTCENRDTRS